MRTIRWFSVLALAVLLGGGGQALAQTEKNSPKADPVSFGTLRSMDREAARSQAQAWLKGVGKTDDATMKAFDAIWTEQRPVLDQVAATFALGDPQAKKLLETAHDSNAAAPLDVPALVKDTKTPSFYRANFALAYAKALCSREVYEEALETLKTVKVDDVCDPSAYLFHKAVCEHALLMRANCEDSIVRLLEDTADAPDRYKMVAVLMHFDMVSWSDKDLDWVARQMQNVRRRLDLARGGPQTQDIEKQVVRRLDEMIKEQENKQSGC